MVFLYSGRMLHLCAPLWCHFCCCCCHTHRSRSYVLVVGFIVVVRSFHSRWTLPHSNSCGLLAVGTSIPNYAKANSNERREYETPNTNTVQMSCFNRTAQVDTQHTLWDTKDKMLHFFHSSFRSFVVFMLAPLFVCRFNIRIASVIRSLARCVSCYTATSYIHIEIRRNKKLHVGRRYPIRYTMSMRIL